MVKVYRYRVYDITSDDYRYSSRMATLERIEKIGGERLDDTEANIDEKLLTDGWTRRRFNPDRKASN